MQLRKLLTCLLVALVVFTLVPRIVSAQGSTGLDPLSVLTYVLGAAFGGSGIAAWYLTYLQMKGEKKKQALEYFRQIVLTPDFISYLGLLFTLLSKLERPERAEKSEVMSLFADVVKQKFKIPGVLFFLPDSTLAKLTKFEATCWDAYEVLMKGGNWDEAKAVRARSISDQIQLSTDLKRLLGIEAYLEPTA